MIVDSWPCGVFADVFASPHGACHVSWMCVDACLFVDGRGSWPGQVQSALRPAPCCRPSREPRLHRDKLRTKFSSRIVLACVRVDFEPKLVRSAMCRSCFVPVCCPLVWSRIGGERLHPNVGRKTPADSPHSLYRGTVSTRSTRNFCTKYCS